MDQRVVSTPSEVQQGRNNNSERPVLTRRLLETIDTALSECEIRDGPHRAETVPAILDALFSAASREKNDISWKKFGSELGRLALRILAVVERMDNFQHHLCKLLPSLGLICDRSLEAWRQAIRPLLNVFVSKKLDFVHLKRSVKELKNILRCGESEIPEIFTEENVHLLQAFGKLIFYAGDFLLQMDILEIVFIYAAGNLNLAESVLAIASPSTRQLLPTLNFFDFEKDSRILLNAVNVSLAAQKRVFSINCDSVYFGNLSLSPPIGTDGIWMDANVDSKRITISCSDFLSSSDSGQCIILQLPLSEIEKLKLDYEVLSGDECYRITIGIRSLPEMYDFAKGHVVVCLAPSTRNRREAVTNFARVVKELSAEIRERPHREKKYPSDLRPKKNKDSGINPGEAGKRRGSCTSPVIFNTSSIGKIYKKTERRWNQMSSTSPLTLPTWSWEKMERRPDKTERDETHVKSTLVLKNIHIQVQQISNSSSYVSSSCLANDGRRVTLPRDELSNQSKLNVEKGRLNGDKFCERGRRRNGEEDAREDRQGNGEQSPRFASIRQDFLLSQGFQMTDNRNAGIKTISSDSTNIRPTGGAAGKVNRDKAKKDRCRSRTGKLSNTEERWRTSLLDPNGYAYMRWTRPTTSERSNFWLNKLKHQQKTGSNPGKDVFHFNEEGNLTEETTFFYKDRVSKEGKSTGVSGRVRRKWNKTDENRNIHLETIQRELTETECNLETRVNVKGRRSKCERIAKKGNRIGSDERSTVRLSDDSYGEHDISTLSNDLSLSNKEGKGGRAEKDTETEGTPSLKRKFYQSGRAHLASPVSPPHQNNLPEFGYLHELDDVTKRLSSAFDKLIQDMTEWEVRHARNYAEEAKTWINAMAEEEEDHHRIAKRSKRFELCIQYFFQGCSTFDSNRDLQSEMENLIETVGKLKKKEKYFEEKGTPQFAEKLKEIIGEATEISFNNKIKHFTINQLKHLINEERTLDAPTYSLLF